ncbi:hypothetical protein [Vibrio owensii]|uniref:hypothetical protein n=1 Tax=Vibrio owensii TaxID=696485 RepID=UPI0038CF17CA
MRLFFTKYVVTKGFRCSLLQISLVTILFFLLGYVFLKGEHKLTLDNFVSLSLNTVKFSMWFFFGYGALQALGIRIEKNKLTELSDKRYRAHAQEELNIWTDMARNDNDEGALKDLAKIDSQFARIKGDQKTANKLWVVGFIMFLVVSVFEIIYPAFK